MGRGAGSFARAALVGLALAAGPMTAAGAERHGPVGAMLKPLPFAAIPGWAQDDHAAAFSAFLVSCGPVIEGRAETRRAKPADDALAAVCRAAVARSGEADARAFFETRFAPFEVVPESGRGFLTGYYEPEVAGSRTPTADFAWPIRARPPDLVTRTPDEPLGGLDPSLAAGRRAPTGLVEMPDRAAIEAGALGADAPPLLYVRDEVEAFFIHVQGSARVRLTDGSVVRLAYAGRNGHAYTAIGRLLVTGFGLTPEEVTLEKLKAWLRAHPQEGRALMRRNRSFIFFRVADELRADEGPIGGAGLPLAPGRSLAVDRNLWSYGLPLFVAADVPEEVAPSGRIARLTVAQDTGSAILGPARGDLFFGAGEEMGRRAGALRHAARFIVLLPREGVN